MMKVAKCLIISYIGNTSIARFATIYSSNTQGNNAETIFSLQNKLYRYKIEIPLFRCECCYAFLFNEQVKYIMKETNITRKARVNVNDIVCNYCFGKLAKNELPCISVYGNKLHPGLIPECLKRMTLMEKRLISRIHVFLTVIILPGGQFAAKRFSYRFSSLSRKKYKSFTM